MYLTYDSGLRLQSFTLYQTLKVRVMSSLTSGVLPIATRVLVAGAVVVEYRKCS